MKTTSKIRKMLILVSIGFGLCLAAQEKVKPSINSYDYKNAIGVRIGETSGLTFKYFFDKGHAFEAIVSAYPYTIGLTALYEKHMQTNISGLLWYYGAGGHVNVGGPTSRVFYRYYGDRRYAYVYRYGGYALGIDGILGLEYKIKPIPLSLSLDIKPFAEFNDYGNMYLTLDPGLGIKFTF